MQRKSAWLSYETSDTEALRELTDAYIEFLSTCKTERECASFSIKQAREAGYISLEEARELDRPLKAGDKIYAGQYGKTVMLVQLGSAPLTDGLNILGAHIDSPRLDIKQNPAYESSELALLDTHYYGGIKKYQWVTLPLALHGVIVRKDGTSVHVSIGEASSDPVFCVTDLLAHLSQEQMQKTGAKLIEGEDLDLLVGNKPLHLSKEEMEKAAEEDPESPEALAAKEPVKAMLLSLLKKRFNIDEEDFLSAELEVVPAGRARSLGVDESMILGYGQDDRVCAYTSLQAMLEAKDLKRTGVCLLVDKEEIGSVGATGMTSRFFENTMAEILHLAGQDDPLALRHTLARSSMLSSDVSAGFDPLYASAFEAKNAAYLGHGLVFNKYVGARGKSGSNDANAEYMAQIRRIMDEREVAFQTAELGRIDVGGGGTIAYILAEYGMNVIDSGVAVLSMHAPWEVTSKADVFEAYKGYKAFLDLA